MSKLFKLLQGDCLELMRALPDESVDLILCDLPYGQTANKWDVPIDADQLWAHYRRIIKPACAIVLTGSQPFTSHLVLSNTSWFKYMWVWDKGRSTNFFAAKYVPLNHTEDVVVFSSGGCNNGSKQPMRYFPQGVEPTNRVARNCNTGGKTGLAHKTSLNDGRLYHQTTTNYPKKILRFGHDSDTAHPTQKPVALMEYLVCTYTQPGDAVLDNCMGSGTTGVACANTGRKFIGMELDEAYFNTAQNRIRAAYKARKRV